MYQNHRYGFSTIVMAVRIVCLQYRVLYFLKIRDQWMLFRNIERIHVFSYRFRGVTEYLLVSDYRGPQTQPYRVVQRLNYILLYIGGCQVGFSLLDRKHEPNPRALGSVLIANVVNIAMQHGKPHYGSLLTSFCMIGPLVSLNNEICQHECCYFRLVFCQRVLPPRSC